MKKKQQQQGPEIFCISSMGNEPGLKREDSIFTAQDRALLSREIDNETDQAKKRELLKSVKGKKPKNTVTVSRDSKRRSQIKEMRVQVKEMRAQAAETIGK